MPSEDWEFRREARRCMFSASQAQSPRAQRMLDGLARFYDSLAATDGPHAASAQEAETAVWMSEPEMSSAAPT